MNALLDLIKTNAKLSDTQIAEQLDLSPNEVRSQIKAWEDDGTILGYQAIVDPAKANAEGVAAFIEVRVSPERGGGFDRIADRISKFEQVSSCRLMSGGFDLAVIVEGRNLHDVARFVSEKLSTLEGVLSTATHFELKTYKQNGLIAHGAITPHRLPVAP